MKTNHFLIALLLTVISQVNLAASFPKDASYDICFTPKGACTQDIIDTINKAKKTIYVQAYNFTSKSIAEALIKAHKREVVVSIILDKSQKTQKASQLNRVIEAGIPVWIDYKPAIAHNKVMIFDEETVITGSFNFTDSAQKRNAENLIIINDAKVAKTYLKNWRNRQEQSREFKNIVGDKK